MNTPVRFGASLSPSEPARVLTGHLLQAAAEISPLPRWLERYPLTAMSPGTRQLAWAVGRHVTRNPDHGFELAERVPPQAVGSLWPMYEAAPTLAAVHEAYAKYGILLLDPMVCAVSRGAERVSLFFEPVPSVRLDRAEEDFRAAMQVKTWRALLRNEQLAPVAVHFTYARPKSTRRHEVTLGTRILRFEQPCFGFELSLRWWDAPLPLAEPEAFARRCRELDRAMRDHEATALESQVEALATGLLGTDPRAESVAEMLGMSGRTLRRRLSQRGWSFRQLVQRARARELALLHETEAIAGAPLPSRARARLLGFANAGALRNALRRWGE